MLKALIIMVQMCTGQICEVDINADLISWRVKGEREGVLCIVENIGNAQCLSTDDPDWRPTK